MLSPTSIWPTIRPVRAVGGCKRVFPFVSGKPARRRPLSEWRLIRQLSHWSTIAAGRQHMLNCATVILVGMLNAAGSAAAAPNPYPNEIAGLKFYARYLAPLRPGESDKKRVIEILGSDQGLDLTNWKALVLYSCADDVLACSHGPRNDPVGDIEFRPKHRVSLRHFKFPAVFSRSYGSLSEINVTCDIYSDAFGLEYWVASGDFPSYKEGDLLMIRYGPSRAKVDRAR